MKKNKLLEDCVNGMLGFGDNIDSMAVTNTQKISRLLVQAREDGLIPWEWIVDDSRRMEGDEGRFTDLEQYTHVHTRTVIVADVEKHVDARISFDFLRELIDFSRRVKPMCGKERHAILVEDRRQDARYRGFFTDDDHPLKLMCPEITTVGTLDHMSEVDLPERLDRYGAGGFEFRRIALTDDDVGGGDFPSFPAKETDPRYDWYVEHYGRDAWELDAMDPNILRHRVEQHVVSLIDSAAWEDHKLVEEAQRECVQAIAAKMAIGSDA